MTDNYFEQSTGKMKCAFCDTKVENGTAECPKCKGTSFVPEEQFAENREQQIQNAPKEQAVSVAKKQKGFKNWSKKKKIIFFIILAVVALAIIIPTAASGSDSNTPADSNKIVITGTYNHFNETSLTATDMFEIKSGGKIVLTYYSYGTKTEHTGTYTVLEKNEEYTKLEVTTTSPSKSSQTGQPLIPMTSTYELYVYQDYLMRGNNKYIKSN